MDITAAAPRNNHPDETHHLVTLRLSGVYAWNEGVRVSLTQL